MDNGEVKELLLSFMFMGVCKSYNLTYFIISTSFFCFLPTCRLRFVPGSAGKGGGVVVAGSRTARQCVDMGILHKVGHNSGHANPKLRVRKFQKSRI